MEEGAVKRAWEWRLSFTQLLVFVAVAAPVVVALRFSLSTIDLAYLIRSGEFMLDTGDILRRDVFTFTVSGQEWLNQQWGAEIVFASIYRVGDWPLLALGRAALVGMAFWLVFLGCRARGAGQRPAAWLTLASLVVSLDGLALRPQLLGFALFALALWMVACRDKRPRSLWLLPVVVIVWANVHGSFVLAPVVLLIAWLEDRRRHAATTRTTLIVALVCVASAVINPFGLRIWTYVADLGTDPEIRRAIAEWRPTTPWTPVGAVFFVSVAAVALIVVRARAGLRPHRVIGLGLFLVLGLVAVRGVFWWALAAPVLIADLFADGADERDDRSNLNTALAAALGVAAIALLPWFRPTFASTANSARVTDGLLAHSPQQFASRIPDIADPGARMFVPELWASWFEFSVRRYPVFVDPRIEIFPVEVWRAYDAISRGDDGWDRILDRWDVDILVLSREQQSGLISRIEDHPTWTEVFEDADGLLLVRSPTPEDAA